MEEQVYIRMKARIRVRQPSSLTLGNIASIIADDQFSENLDKLPVSEAMDDPDSSPVVIDSMKIVRLILKEYPALDVQIVGPVQTIVWHQVDKQPMKPVMFALVWFLLFVGSALAIMNFHEDVSMSGVHQKLYKVLTGTETDKPLWLQIPYSFGLGLGMVLFFNHLFRKRINDEPSPLEMEMFNYQDNIDRYVALNHRHPNEQEKNND
ncbi:stage V sporulation protein AA [Alteribacter lacisalsi]|uniref:Stage V sporulation protein AA n=1 Tax=Alteribacter lacisalsi TaxID=2045244 RepID=A0A2W0HNP5_9BACI|nr:stage V sporulation protein AA [Alteribacter lacisalsi]PYZ98499.1 stage V sporulation protein AA [Alteribacter lacisalsi]